MHLGGTLVFIFALLCTVGGSKEEVEHLHKEYLSLCNYAYPDAKEMEVYLFQEYFCTFVCLGKGEEDEFIGRAIRKSDGTECDPIFYGPQNSFQCYNNSCELSEPYNACKKESATIGKLKSVEINECQLTCKGEKDNKTMSRAKGTICTPKNRGYQLGYCTKDGMCKEKRTWVKDPAGGNKIDKQVAARICRHRHENSNDTGGYMLVFGCEFLCWFQDNTMEQGSHEILTVQDDYECDDQDPTKKCLGGKCTPPVEVKKCQDALKDTVTRVDTDGCSLKCKGINSQKMALLPENSQCLVTLPNEDTPRSGKCTKDGQCNTNSEPRTPAPRT